MHSWHLLVTITWNCLGCTLGVYIDNVMLTPHNVALTSQKSCQYKTSSPMGNGRSPWSQHNVWRHYNLRCSKSGNSELETVTSNQFKNIRYYASSSYLQILKRSELKLQRKPGESVVVRCSRAANSVVSDEI